MAEKKQIICPKCKAKLKFDPDKITSDVAKFKCPGCAAVLRIRKSDAPKETPLPAAAGQPASPVEIPDIESVLSDSSAGNRSDSGVGASAPPKTEDAVPSEEESFTREEHGPLIPADRIVIPQGPGESLLEDFDHVNLREYEEGEAEPGDLEWTRYADKRDPKLPDSKIDLNVVPASIDGLHDTLADLQQAEMYNLQGEANLEKNLVRQAIRDFNHALEINPDFIDALVNRGSAYVLQNEYNDALRDFNHALGLGGRQAEIYNIRGEIYLLSRMYDEAIKDFTAAIILNPVYSDAYLNRAKAYNEKGMSEEAEADFSQAIRADSDKFSSYADLAASESLFEEDGLSNREKAAKFMTMGLNDLKNENYPQAIENFTQVIKVSPDNAMAYINRGQAYVELNQPDEAMVDLNKAVIYDPLNPSLYYWRAKTWKLLDSPINMVADLKLSCELGYQPACEEYESCKPQKH